MPSSKSKKTATKKSASGKTVSEIVTSIAATCGLPKAQVTAVFDSLGSIVAAELKGGRPVKVPGLAKIVVVRKPATPERTGRNPFTGQQQVFKAKPPRNAVKVRPLKALKDMVL